MLASLDLNAAEHPLAFRGSFETVDEYQNYLMHMRAFQELESIVAGKDVLDLGCNNGYGTAHLQPATASIVGVDVSASAIADGRLRFPELRLETYEGDALPFADESFDVVVSLQVIEHIDVARTPVFLAEAARVLRPAGLAAFTTPNAAVRVTPGRPPWNRFHVREFTADELHAELAPFFATVELRGLHASRPVQERILARYEANRRSQGSMRSNVRSRLPWLVPIVQRARGLRRRATHERVDLTAYSTADFRYSTEDLGTALDFFAVCRRQDA